VGSLGHVVFVLVCHDNLFFLKIYEQRGGLPFKRGSMSLSYLINEGSEYIGKVSECIRQGSEYTGRSPEYIRKGSEYIGRGSEYIRKGSEYIGRGSEWIGGGSRYIPDGARHRFSAKF
jgi:hypothetical protein